MIVAGIGCRRDCPAEDIVALVARAGAMCAPPDALAAPAFKCREPGLHAAASRLGLRLIFVSEADMAAAQPFCQTSSSVTAAAVGVASVAEAAAIGRGGTLILPRIAAARATLALARHPEPA